MLPLCVSARWAFARHMARSEPFISAMCSQLGLAVFVTFVSRDNDDEGDFRYCRHVRNVAAETRV